MQIHSDRMQPLCRNRAYSAEGRLFHLLFTSREKFFHVAFLRRLRISRSLAGAILLYAQSRRDAMNSTDSQTCGLITAGFPPLRQPKPEIADRGAVRLGSGSITGGFPPRR